jgi:long-chain acyl-CoA synthetase
MISYLGNWGQVDAVVLGLIDIFPVAYTLPTSPQQIALITFQWIGVVKKFLTPTPMRSVPVGDDESHRVNTKYKGNLMNSSVEGVTTLHELAQFAFKRYGHRNAMGEREYLGPYSPKVQKFGEVSWRTYDQVKDASLKFGASLRSVGLVASPEKATLDKLSTPCTLAIFENTCPEWMIAALGAYSQSISVTTVYATLGINAVIDSINDGKIRAIVCNKKSVKILLGKLGDMPTLKVIVYTNNMIAPGEKVDLPAAPKGVTVLSFDDFVNAGDTKAFTIVPPKPDTTAVIMYTSGSTGEFC